VVGGRFGDPDGVHADAAVDRAVPPADDGQPAAVSDRREDQLVQRRPVERGVHPVRRGRPEPGGDVVAAWHDLVRAQGGHQVRRR